jgi:hypothetical protein
VTLPVTVVLLSVYEPVIVGHIVVAPTTEAVEAWLAVAQDEVVAVAEYASPETRLNPVILHAPLALAVVVQVAVVGAVRVSVTAAPGAAVPLIEVAPATNVPLELVVITGGWL